MPQAATVVSHRILISSNVVKLRFVPEMALVEGRELKEVCSRSNSCGCTPFRSPGHSRGVIAKATGGNMRNWDSRRQDVVTGNGTSQFKVAVGDGASWILEGDDLVLDGKWERGSP